MFGSRLFLRFLYLIVKYNIIYDMLHTVDIFILLGNALVHIYIYIYIYISICIYIYSVDDRYMICV